MRLETVMKFGYFFVVVTMILMVWASLSSAKDIVIHKYPPCSFNVLCSCSKIAPDLGTVQCQNVPFSRIPSAINVSKVYSLTMENTGLLEIEPYFLQATGLYQLKIVENNLNDIEDDAFHGLERSLRELFLYKNHLTEIPSKSLRNLQNLKILDLHSNEINFFDKYSWNGFGKSLKSINLAKNSIFTIPKDGFNDLPSLEILDLSGNNIAEIDPNIFNEGLGKINKLLLADNILKSIPYLALTKLNNLKFLDLSFNRISSVLSSKNLTVKLSIDVLHLDYNFINELPTNSFNNFNIINKTILNGNQINDMQNYAFRNAKIRELYLESCGISYINKNAFDGLENTLQILDLSHNNFTYLPENLLRNFSSLNVLSLEKSPTIKQYPMDVIIGIGQTLHQLNIDCEDLGLNNLQSIKIFQNLNHLSLNKLQQNSLSHKDFTNFNSNIEILELNDGSIQKIDEHCFQNMRGIRELNLNDNKITNIDKNAFADIGFSLVTLSISHGFSSQTLTLPHESFQFLNYLQKLDLSNNRFRNIPENSFHFLKNLKYLLLHDNQIEEIHRGTFQGELHKKIEEIILSFNNLKQIKTFTFSDLDVVKNIQLDDNRLEKIDRQAISNLNELHTINLRGNKIKEIEYEAFQNLPKLDMLDLSYNELQNFEFNYMDQVGSLASLYLNLSHNHINGLIKKNKTELNDQYQIDSNLYLNIKVFDLSYNNITNMDSEFFKPVQLSLTHLHLKNNKLKNLTKQMLGNLMHLQWLDLSYNLLSNINSNVFRDTKKIQVIDLSHNKLNEISNELFLTIKSLRIVDLSNNNIRFIPDSLFPREGIECFDVSNNQLTKVPSSAFTNLAALSLTKLNLSYNNIGAVNSVDFSKFRYLAHLDLSFNRIIRLEEAVFATLFHLSYLDLSHNNEIDVVGKSFIGLEDNLIELKLSNLSLKIFPELSLPHLRKLILSHNRIDSVSYDLAKNISSIKNLDLSYNYFNSTPLILHSLPLLKSLSLAGNKLRIIKNDTLIFQSTILDELDLTELLLTDFESGALDKLTNIKKLKISCYSHLNNFKISKIIQNLDSLRSLTICGPVSMDKIKDGKTSDIKTDLRREMDGFLPEKLYEVSIIGPEFYNLADTIFIGLRSPILKLYLINTSITKLSNMVFRNIPNLKNISLYLSNSNDELRKISNPISSKISLIELEVSGTQLTCDCEIGWIEYWARKKRQDICPMYSNGISRYSDLCKYTNDLRKSECINKNNLALIEVLKSDLECGWENNAKHENYSTPLIILGLILLMWI